MRLLNTKSFEFEEFFDSQIPKYAILSHRWGSEEVSFQEFRKGKKKDSQGYNKIRRCCAVADRRGLDWVWIDTCCIDKKSSAELSEAINSMYRWYKLAVECYAYLSDVKWEYEDCEASKVAFRQSVWFTRGWTLQELLAPANVVFFDRDWKTFGTKEDLSKEISDVTGIMVRHLTSRYLVCVATRMSWVSRRATSRIEDMAYCMLGLFNVNMPLMYGEGEKAFMRLQLEIIKNTDDESIFAWTSSQTSSGMLASHPSYFAESGDITTDYLSLKTRRFPYLMTNQGLEIRLPNKNPFTPSHQTFLHALNCWRSRENGDPLALTIILKHSEYLCESGWIFTWQRVECGKLPLSQPARNPISYTELPRNTTLIHVPQEGMTSPW